MYQNYNVENTPTTRVDRWLKRAFTSLTQGQIEKWLRSKDILVNGKKVDAAYRISDDDVVQIKKVVVSIIGHQEKEPPKTLHHVPRRDDADDLESWILYDDEEFIILNKPSGIATQGGTGTIRHVDQMLKAYSYYYDSKHQLRLVHRLDRDTSGILVIAKTLKSANHLAEQFKMKEMEKLYWAISHGKPSPLHGVINAPLVKKVRASGDGEAVYVDMKNGKKALTTYRVVKSFGNLCWFDLRPQTGRTHQLRVHMAHIGTPIVGDSKYGEKDGERRKENDKGLPLHLHARSLTLTNLDGNVMAFTAPPPEHMVETLRFHGIDWEYLV
jgi:23S rRNA pseudouridine955/2504/2580 synthase